MVASWECYLALGYERMKKTSDRVIGEAVLNIARSLGKETKRLGTGQK